MDILISTTACKCGCYSFTVVGEKNLYCNKCDDKFPHQVKITSSIDMFGNEADTSNNGKIINN